MNSTSRLTALVVLGLLAVVIAAARLRTASEPLERDLTTYAVIAHEWLGGRALYADLWDHKPPAIHLTYAAFELLAGYGSRAVYLLGVCAALVTLGGVYVAAAAATGERGAGLWAAAYWAVVSGDLRIQANQPNTEVWINACVVWALALLLGDRGGSRAGRGLAVGTLLALASWYKPVMMPCAAVLVAADFVWPAGAPGGRWARLARAGWMVVPGVALWLGFFAWMGWRGTFPDMVDAVFVYNRSYSGNMLLNLARGLAPWRLCPPALWGAAPLVVVALVAAYGGARRGLSGLGRQGALLCGCAVAVVAAIALPGQFYAHYYQLWLPLLAIAAACARTRVHATALKAAVLLVLVALQVPSYFLSAEAWSQKKYGLRYIEARDLARRLDAVMKSEETLWEWGADTGLYFYSGRRPACGVIYVYPLLKGPLVDSLSRRVLRELEARPPDAIVVNQGVAADATQPVVRWFTERYVATPMRGGADLVVLARRGSALEERLHSLHGERGAGP